MMASSSGWLPFFFPTWIMPGIWCVFAFTHEIRDGHVDDQDFERGDAAWFIDAFEKILRDDAFQRFSQRRANLVLLIRRENIDNAVDGLRRRSRCAVFRKQGGRSRRR